MVVDALLHAIIRKRHPKVLARIRLSHARLLRELSPRSGEPCAKRLAEVATTRGDDGGGGNNNGGGSGGHGGSSNSNCVNDGCSGGGAVGAATKRAWRDNKQTTML